MHDIELVNLVEQLAERLDCKGIEWCVLRNYETFPRPRSDTSDIDIIVAHPLSNALGQLRISLADTSIGIGRVFIKSSSGLVGVFLTKPSSPALHIDLFHHIDWFGQALVSSEVLLAERSTLGSIPVPRAGHEAAVSLMSYLFHRGHVKPEYRDRLHELLMLDRSGFIKCLRPVWGEKTSSALAERVVQGDWAWFSTWVTAARRRLLLSALQHPVVAMKNLLVIASNMAQRVVSPPGLWIVILGPDGSGKTTISEAYRERLSTLFTPAYQRHLHWRPRWLPAPGSLAGGGAEPTMVTEPHLKPLRGKPSSVFRLLYFWLDYVLGHWIRVRPLLARGGLVTFDRYYQDFLVDPRRYRLDVPSWFIRLLGRVVPQPELVFILDAPAAVLYRRKQELPEAEIERQLVALRTLAAENSSVRIVRVDREIAEIVDDLERETLAYLDRRNRRRLGWGFGRQRRSGGAP